MAEFDVEAVLRRHTGDAAWHFVTLPQDVAEHIRELAAGAHAPFGSVPVRATLGASTWSTSVFSDTRSGSYLLPVKAQIRRRERVGDGDSVRVRVALDL